MDSFVCRLLALEPLTTEEERSLARRSRDGDRSAREALVIAGLRGAALQALMLGARDERLRDAVQAAAVALIKAVDRFDPDRGTRLATYAWPWIRGAVLDELTGQRTIALTETANDQAPREGAEAWLDGLDPVAADVVRLRFGVRPGTDPLARRAVAERLGLRESQVRRIEAEAMRQLRTRLGRIVNRAPA